MIRSIALPMHPRHILCIAYLRLKVRASHNCAISLFPYKHRFYDFLPLIHTVLATKVALTDSTIKTTLPPGQQGAPSPALSRPVNTTAVVGRPSASKVPEPDINSRLTAMAPSTSTGASAAASTTPSSQIFRFLDLPAELRNRIYKFAGQSSRSTARCKLAEYKVPLIAGLNKQTRTEALSLMFAETHFDVFVGCNLNDYFFDKGDYRACTRAGTLTISNKIKVHCRRAGRIAAFRSVSFNVCEVSRLQRARAGHLDALVCEVKLSWARSGLQVEVKNKNFPQGSQTWGEAEVLAAVETLKAECQLTTTRWAFNGFAIDDLCRFANEFRLKKV